MRLGKRAAEHGEVLAEHEDQPAVDRTVTGHHAIAGDTLVGHAEITAAMLDEHVGLFERIRVEQELHALAGGKLAALVLRLDPALATAEPGRRALGIELLEDLLHRAFSTPPDRDGQVAWPLRRRKPTAARQLSLRPAGLVSVGGFPQARPYPTQRSPRCRQPTRCRFCGCSRTRCGTCWAIWVVSPASPGRTTPWRRPALWAGLP